MLVYVFVKTSGNHIIIHFVSFILVQKLLSKTENTSSLIKAPVKSTFNCKPFQLKLTTLTKGKPAAPYVVIPTPIQERKCALMCQFKSRPFNGAN